MQAQARPELIRSVVAVSEAPSEPALALRKAVFVSIGMLSQEHMSAALLFMAHVALRSPGKASKMFGQMACWMESTLKDDTMLTPPVVTAMVDVMVLCGREMAEHESSRDMIEGMYRTARDILESTLGQPSVRALLLYMLELKAANYHVK